eukprot:596360-Rhodomonas_salina.4
MILPGKEELLERLEVAFPPSVLRRCFAMSGTDLGYALGLYTLQYGDRDLGLPENPLDSIIDQLGGAIVLRCRYAMSGTEIAYAASRRKRTAVLTQRMLLGRKLRFERGGKGRWELVRRAQVNSAIRLRPRYEMSGTKTACYGASGTEMLYGTTTRMGRSYQ